jgi:alkanesulfonate monooxygenase SsuD/methylene tetrahydromethanopterin reductase-like flavin-dependent oxidoreductase (luciferase family)
VNHALVFPNAGAFAVPRLLAELAYEAEVAGFDGFFVSDTVELEGNPVCDPWIALAAAATATERIRIGTLVLALARRRPWLAAREAVTLDHLSGGRLILGVGAGFGDMGFTRFGESDDARIKAARLDEGLVILCGLMTGNPFRFSGGHYTVAETTFLPRPVQEHVPIWIAANRGAKVRGPLERASRHDGILGDVGRHNAEEILAFVRERRGPDVSFDLVASVHGDDEMADVLDNLADCEAKGITWVRYELGSMFDTLDDLGPARRFVSEGVPTA